MTTKNFSKYDLMLSLNRIVTALKKMQKEFGIFGVLKWDVQLLEEAVGFIKDHFPNDPLAMESREQKVANG